MGPLGGKRKHRDMEDTHIFLVGAFVVSRAANQMLPAQPIGFIAMCGPWSNLFVEEKQIWSLPGHSMIGKMAKKRSKQNKDTGKRKPRKSAAQKQKQREMARERMASFNETKAEEQACKDMAARETALKQLGIGNVFEFADHAKIYNAEQGKYSSAPIEVIDASVPPAPVTLHPERSPSPAAHREPIPDKQADFPANFSFIKCAPAPRRMDAARARRAKAILAASCSK